MTEANHQQSLATAAARNLATTTKSVPQMQEITSRWLLKLLPWVETKGGVYRVNRRLTYAIGDGRVTFTNTGADIDVIPAELRELPLLRDLDDDQALTALAGRFTQQEFNPGDLITEKGHTADRIILIAHGKASKLGTGEYGATTILKVLADGEFAGSQHLTGEEGRWEFSVQALTPCIVLALSRRDFQSVADRSPALASHLERLASGRIPPHNKFGEAAIDLSSGHAGEPDLPGTFVDYEAAPREYELSVAQTVLRVHTRVGDLYSQPMDQREQQLRLTVEALRERQEHELINNRDFGLLHNADLRQRIYTRLGPPTPDDLDELISRRRKTRCIFAHPRAIAAVGRECSRRGVYPEDTEIDGRRVRAWRGIPMLPCDKIPVTPAGTTSILAMRTGRENEGVIGLHQTGLPDEYEPGLSVRSMGITEKGIATYLVSTYFSAAVLVPDALGILEGVAA